MIVMPRRPMPPDEMPSTPEAAPPGPAADLWLWIDLAKPSRHQNLPPEVRKQLAAEIRALRRARQAGALARRDSALGRNILAGAWSSAKKG